jgi:Helix-turn-helix domain
LRLIPGGHSGTIRIAMDYDPDDFLTIQEAAAICRYKGVWAIRKLIKRNLLPAFKPSYRQILIPKVAFNKWFNSRRMRASATNHGNNQAEE